MVQRDFTLTNANLDNETSRRYLHIITWGCQMNVYDSNRMVDLLRPLGYKVTDKAEQADVLLTLAIYAIKPLKRFFPN